MSALKYLVIHCTATPPEMEVTRQMIFDWHTSPPPRGRGWSRPGYADMINLRGELVSVWPFDNNDTVELWEVTNGVAGINGLARHVVYAGGVDVNKQACDTRNPAQSDCLRDYVRYMIRRHPQIAVAGHYQFDAKKYCPSFDVPTWLREIGVPEWNIYKG